MSTGSIGGDPRVRGTAFLGVFNYLKQQRRGESLRERIEASLSPQTTESIGKKIIAVADYPYAAFVDLLRVTDKTAGLGNLELCRKLGEYAGSLDTAAIYSMYKKRRNPRGLAKDCGRIWKSYYINAGAMTPVSIEPENTVVRIVDFPQMDPAHCRLMEGWMNQALTDAGATIIEPIREVKCASKGGDCHEFAGRWIESDK